MRKKSAGISVAVLTAVIALCGGRPICSADAGEDDANRPVGRGLEAVRHAAKAEEDLFVFFYKGQDAQTRKMREVFDSATQKVEDDAEAIAVNVSDASERGIVDKFRVGRAPMPLVLVVAPNGAIAGGFPSKFEEEQLLNALVSPCMAECLKGLQERKLVFVCVQNKKTKENEAAMKGVRAFEKDRRFSGATEVLKVDPADRDEKAFLAKLQVDLDTDKALTVFLAPPGTRIATIQGATDKEALVTKLMSAMSSCGPGGGGCGPSGCK